MSDTSDIPTQPEEAPISDMSSSPPPSYSYHGDQPPPYFTPPPTYSPPKTENADINQPSTGYQSFSDVYLDTAAETMPLISSSSFDDETVRRGFVRKVFGILTLQLVFTFSVVCVFTFWDVVKEAVQANVWAYISSLIVFTVVAVILSCNQSFSRRHPWNIVGLVIVTLSLSYMVGTMASYHKTTAVAITMGETLVVSLAIIIFSAQTKWDFTICSGVMLVLALSMTMFAVLYACYSSYFSELAYGTLGALLYSMFLLIDCQLMMGMMSYRMNPEEYVNAALTIYLDIVLIFLYLLGRR